MNKKLDEHVTACEPCWCGECVTLGTAYCPEEGTAYCPEEEELDDLRTFRKFDDVKSRVDLIPPEYILAIGHVLRFGTLKYDVDNWKLCTDPQRFLAAAYRHVLALLDGEEYDPESGLPHTAHVGCCMGMYHHLLDLGDGDA